MFKYKISTFFCIISVLSCSANALDDAEDDVIPEVIPPYYAPSDFLHDADGNEPHKYIPPLSNAVPDNNDADAVIAPEDIPPYYPPSDLVHDEDEKEPHKYIPPLQSHAVTEDDTNVAPEDTPPYYPPSDLVHDEDENEPHKYIPPLQSHAVTEDDTNVAPEDTPPYYPPSDLVHDEDENEPHKYIPPLSITVITADADVALEDTPPYYPPSDLVHDEDENEPHKHIPPMQSQAVIGADVTPEVIQQYYPQSDLVHDEDENNPHVPLTTTDAPINNADFDEIPEVVPPYHPPDFILEGADNENARRNHQSSIFIPENNPSSKRMCRHISMKYYRSPALSLPIANLKPPLAKRPNVISFLNLNGPSEGPSVDLDSNLQLYRSDLLKLIVKAMEDVETNRTYLKAFMHKNPNESKVTVKVGDLVKFVESKYNKLRQLYSKLRTNSLRLPNLVHAYGEILRGKHEIITVLEVLQNKKPEQVIYMPNREDRYEPGIAWSYYDENF